MTPSLSSYYLPHGIHGHSVQFGQRQYRGAVSVGGPDALDVGSTELGEMVTFSSSAMPFRGGVTHVVCMCSCEKMRRADTVTNVTAMTDQRLASQQRLGVRGLPSYAVSENLCAIGMANNSVTFGIQISGPQPAAHWVLGYVSPQPFFGGAVLITHRRSIS